MVRLVAESASSKARAGHDVSMGPTGRHGRVPLCSVPPVVVDVVVVLGGGYWTFRGSSSAKEKRCRRTGHRCLFDGPSLGGTRVGPSERTGHEKK